VPTIKEWIVIVVLVALVLIPICWKFWMGWDRPSLRSILEMKRRIRERDIREAFIEEDAKIREEHRLEAARELSLRKAQASAPIEKSLLNSAFGNLGVTDSTGTAILGGSVVQPDEAIVTPIENVGALVDSLDIEDIADDIIPEAAPVAVQLHADSGVDDIKWDASQDEDDWEYIEWS
jgi:hypothetical protein